MTTNSSSLEDLIELPEIPKTDNYGKLKRQNKIHSPRIESSLSKQKQSDVVSLFSIKNTKQKKSAVSTEIGDSQSISELSDDVFVKEKTGSILTKSEKSSKSYKDKIRDRFKNVKKHAGVSSSKADLFKSKFTLPVERVRKESTNIDAEIESARSRLNLNRDNVKYREKYDFFVKDCGSNVQNEQDDKDFVFRHTKAELLEDLVEVSEKEHVFVPRRKNIDISDKLSNSEPRYLETEGIYVEPELKISKSQLNIVENRLLNSENKSKWFKCDGSLNVLSSPVKNRSIKPDVDIQFEETTKYSRAIFEEECSEIVIVKENTLHLNFKVLKFKHHPLFSTEHVLVEKLKELFEEYREFVENNKLQIIKSQLEAMRLVKNNLEKSEEEKENSLKKSKENYTKEIKYLRELYFKESKRHRENLKNILYVWKFIKNLRTNNKYSNTNIRLMINKENVDLNLEKEAYDKFFETTLKEIINEKKRQYKLKLKAYNKKIEATKEENRSESDEDTATENIAKKPVYDIDESKISDDLKSRMEECLKSPGEPNLHLKLTESNEISLETTENLEISRRNSVLTTNVALKVCCNDILVCKTKRVGLKDNFEVDFNENLSIRLTDIPKSLRVDIFEYPKGLLKKKICSLDINLPLESVSNKLFNVFCENKDIVHYKHLGVGSGVALKDVLPDFDLKKNESLNTSGFLTYEIGWERTLDKENLAEINVEALNDIIDKYGAINTEKFKEWMEQDVPDPQDPKNSVLYDYFSKNNYLQPKRNDQSVFRLNPYMESLNFCSLKEIEENARIQMLRLRDQNEIEFDGMVIPNRIKEIPLSLLNAYKRRKSTEEKGLKLEIDETTDSRSFGRKYLIEVYTKMYQKCKNTDNHLTYDSVIDERYLIYFETLIKTLAKNFVNWFSFQPRMPEPLPKIAQKINNTEIVSNTKVEQPQIVIRILTGKNMPSRKDDTFKSNEQVSDNFTQPFLQISFDDVSVKSGTALGISPVWNETVILPLEGQQTDYLNPNSLTGNIHIDIFDESDNEVRKFDSRKECNWLGEIDIPLSAVTSSNNCLKSSFKAKIAPLLLGYETEIHKQISKVHNKIGNVLYPFYTYIDLEICLKPSVMKLWPNMSELPTNEVPYIYEHILRWNELYNANFPNRKFTALVLDTNGKSNCVTKYIRPLEPPQLISDDFDITPEMCARYVSMIPFYEGSEFHSNIWLTTDQLVNLMIGTILDHAIALTCYFLALKIDAWLLLGYGSNLGSSAYVLVREYVQNSEIPNYYIYDVPSGEKYNILDPFCPLQKVYCLIAGENVWANTQRIDSLSFTRFDLSRKSDWLSLFDSHVSVPTNFINSKISYKLKEDMEALELYLEQKIRKKFAKLRQLDRTIWNYEISSMFKGFLRLFEVDSTHHRSNFEVINDVNKSLKNYNVNGCVFNTSYTSMSSLVKKIKSLNFHVQKESNEEFALSILVQSYPGQIYSVWVFIGCVRN